MMTETTKAPEKELKDLHLDTLEWKSGLRFIEEEIKFINQLLNSYVFEPNTLNLFERLQEYKEQIIKIEEEIIQIHQSIRKHESGLGGVLECDTISCDHFYYQEHELMKMTFDLFYKNFRKLKLQVFNYTGGILRKNKK